MTSPALSDESSVVSSLLAVVAQLGQGGAGTAVEPDVSLAPPRAASRTPYWSMFLLSVRAFCIDSRNRAPALPVPVPSFPAVPPEPAVNEFSFFSNRMLARAGWTEL
uniref:Putative secreted protein n=1 Tax=Anopheles darlingi TaxID=43151 RepID=A0A2M4D420_ANODA